MKCSRRSETHGEKRAVRRDLRSWQGANKVPGQDQAAPENGNGEPEADERVDDGHAERAW